MSNKMALILIGITFVLCVMFIYVIIGNPFYRGLVALVLSILLFISSTKYEKNNY